MPSYSFDYEPQPSLKAVFYGLEKRGKTHGMCSLASMFCKLVAPKGNILCIASESWVDDWHGRLSAATGKRLAVLRSSSPTEILEALKAAERDPEISLVMIDCMTDIESEPRRAFVARTGKPMQFQHYATVDAPYHALVEFLRHTKLHWIATAREKDDKQETDGAEVVIGKTAKSKIGEVARILVHCQRARSKGGENQFDWLVTDTSQNDTARFLGRPLSTIWEPYLRRYMSDSSPKVAEAKAPGGAASRNKGARFERSLLDHFRKRQYAAMRSRQFKKGGGLEPDILAVHFAGGRPLKVECKARKTMPAKSHLDALGQAERAGEGMAIVVSKVERRPISEAVVTMRLGPFLELYESNSACLAATMARMVDEHLDASHEIGFQTSAVGYEGPTGEESDDDYFEDGEE